MNEVSFDIFQVLGLDYGNDLIGNIEGKSSIYLSSGEIKVCDSLFNGRFVDEKKNGLTNSLMKYDISTMNGRLDSLNFLNPSNLANSAFHIKFRENRVNYDKSGLSRENEIFRGPFVYFKRDVIGDLRLVFPCRYGIQSSRIGDVYNFDNFLLTQNNDLFLYKVSVLERELL